MKIRETKASLIAYATEDNEAGTLIKKGEIMGRMNKRNGGFAGASVCLPELNKAFLASKTQMTKEQKERLANLTCYILDTHPDIEEKLNGMGIPKHLVDKITKAFDLIYEVNQECFKK
jgi:hypothetical protein